MDNNDYKVLVDEYEKLNIDRPDMYPLTFGEYVDGFNRRFCVEAHGLYNLAIWAYGGELKENIVIPQVSNFCQELALFQMKGDYSIGKIVHVYPDSMDIWNKIMCCDPPELFLVGEGKKRVIDVNRFAQDVIDKINSN
ncbi:MAG: hypothetical protein ACI4EF_08730 [Coprococcus sp.]